MTVTHYTPAEILTPLSDLRAHLKASAPAGMREVFDAEAIALGRAGFQAKALKAGETAPDFSLPDTKRESVTLSALLARSPVVLTFYRGAWCPYCSQQLKAYQLILPQITRAGATLVAVSPQTPDHSLSTQEKNGLDYPILSDLGNVVARRYGLVYTLDEAIRPLAPSLPLFNGDVSWELPVPATYVIDRSGRVDLAFVDGDFRNRQEPGGILESLRRLAA